MSTESLRPRNTFTVTGTPGSFCCFPLWVCKNLLHRRGAWRRHGRHMSRGAVPPHGAGSPLPSRPPQPVHVPALGSDTASRPSPGPSLRPAVTPCAPPTPGAVLECLALGPWTPPLLGAAPTWSRTVPLLPGSLSSASSLCNPGLPLTGHPLLSSTDGSRTALSPEPRRPWEQTLGTDVDIQEGRGWKRSCRSAPKSFILSSTQEIFPTHISGEVYCSESLSRAPSVDSHPEPCSAVVLGSSAPGEAA